MEKYIKHLPLALFCLTIGKLLIVGANWEGAAVALVAGLLAGAYEFKNQDKRFKELDVKIENIITAANNQAKAIEEIKNSLGSVRIAQQARSLQSSAPSSSSSSGQRIF